MDAGATGFGVADDAKDDGFGVGTETIGAGVGKTQVLLDASYFPPFFKHEDAMLESMDGWALNNPYRTAARISRITRYMRVLDFILLDYLLVPVL